MTWRRRGAAAAGLLALACGRAPDHPNLLLVTLDTTRADHIGAYGYRHVDTPALDRLAAEGVRFERAQTPAPLTLPSHTSLLTGLLPPRHGVRVNGSEVLPESAETLAERLAARGYATAAVVGAFVLDRRFGLAQGFAHYDDDLSDGVQPSRYGYTQRNAQQVTDAALDWLERRPRQQFFLWVHYFDPHAPYAPPGFEPDVERVPYRSPYDAELEFTDAQLARLLAFLDGEGEAERTLVVATADHGEALLEHGEATHGLFAYDATLRVPLLVRFPDRRHAGRVVAQRVSLVDVAPSVLSWLGLGEPVGLDGRPLPLDGEDPGERALYFENFGPAHLFGWSPLWGIVAGDAKWIQAPRPERYDLGSDPHELRDLRGGGAEADDAALRARFEARMAELDAAPRLRAETAEIGAAERAKLEALGYAAGEGEALAELLDWRHPAGADPKDRLDVYREVETGLSWVDQGEREEGVRRLAGALEVDPGNRRAATALSDLAGDAELRPLAIEGLWHFARHPPLDTELSLAVRARLGSALAEEGRHAESAEALRLALGLDPGRAGLHYQLGLALAGAGESAAAQAALRRALELAAEVEPPAWLEDARARAAALESPGG